MLRVPVAGREGALSDPDCEDCSRLLDKYREAVRKYTAAAHQLSGLLGDDFMLALGRADQLRNLCREAHSAVLTHWRTDHDTLSEGL